MINISNVQKSDLSEIVTMINSVYHSNVTSEKYLEWKMKCPISQTVFLKAVLDDKIVAVRAALPMRLYLNNKSMDVYQFCETTTMREYQGKGIFKLITSQTKDLLKEKDIEFVIHFPNKSSLPAYRKSFNTMLIGCLHYKIVLTRFMIECHSHSESKYYKYNGRNVSFINYEEVQKLLIKYFNNKKVESEGSFQRNLTYLNWRYFAHPVNNYKAVILEKEEYVCGYMIFKKSIKGKIIYWLLVDYEVLKEDKEKSIIKSRELRKIIKKMKLSIVIIPFNRSIKDLYLDLEEFINIPLKKINVAITNIKKNRVEKNILKLHLRAGDIDTF